jgi:hypothetical protein
MASATYLSENNADYSTTEWQQANSLQQQKINLRNTAAVAGRGNSSN